MQTENTDGAGRELDTPAVARRLNLSAATVRNLVKDGLLHPRRKTGRVRSPYVFDEPDVAAYERSLNPSAAPAA